MFIGRFVDANGNTIKLTEEVMKKMTQKYMDGYKKGLQGLYRNMFCSVSCADYHKCTNMPTRFSKCPIVIRLLKKMKAKCN